LICATTGRSFVRIMIDMRFVRRQFLQTGLCPGSSVVADLGGNLQNHDLRVVRSPLAGSPLSRGRSQQFTMHNHRVDLFGGVSFPIPVAFGENGTWRSDILPAGHTGNWHSVRAGWQFRKVGIGELVWSQSPLVRGLSALGAWLVGVCGLSASMA
jgi:hypothetical protein